MNEKPLYKALSLPISERSLATELGECPEQGSSMEWGPQQRRPAIPSPPAGSRPPPEHEGGSHLLCLVNKKGGIGGGAPSGSTQQVAPRTFSLGEGKHFHLWEWCLSPPPGRVLPPPPKKAVLENWGIQIQRQQIIQFVGSRKMGETLPKSRGPLAHQVRNLGCHQGWP